MSSKRPRTSDTVRLAQLHVQIIEVQAKTDRQANWLNLIKTLGIAAAVVACLYLIFWGLRPVIDKDASAIQAFASVLYALHVDSIVSSVAALAFGVAWALERSGKKRALKEKAKSQKQLEQEDPYRSSSHNPI